MPNDPKETNVERKNENKNTTRTRNIPELHLYNSWFYVLKRYFEIHLSILIRNAQIRCPFVSYPHAKIDCLIVSCVRVATVFRGSQAPARKKHGSISLPYLVEPKHRGINGSWELSNGNISYTIKYLLTVVNVTGVYKGPHSL